MREAEQRNRMEARKSWVRTIAGVLLATGGGMYLLGLAVHSTDVWNAQIYYWTGVLVWGGGVVVILLRAWHTALERGER